MGDMLINIEKTYASETWINTHCLRVGGAGGPVVDADMTAIGIGTAITTANTASGAAVNALTRLLAFERLMHLTQISITRIYITDGLRNDMTTPDYFWSASLSLPGLQSPTMTTPANIAPGTISLVVNRIPLGYTSRNGRLYLRGVLQENAIAFTMRGGVGWETNQAAIDLGTVLSGAVTNSGLNTMFNGGTNAGVSLYSIPHYLSKKVAPTPHLAGSLTGSTPVVSFTLGAPRSRQMLKGKKRAAPAFG